MIIHLIRMKPRTLAIAAAVLFAVSFALPSYSGFNGLQCFLSCVDVLTDTRPNQETWGRIYYPGFILTNAFFVVSFALGLIGGRARYTRISLTLLAFFHVLSWLVMNLTKEGTERLEIQIGYVVWLVAYVLLFVSQLLETQTRTGAKPAAPANENAT